MIDVLESLPLWQLLAVLNIWLLSTAGIGLWVVRGYVLPWLRLGYDDSNT